MVASVSDLGADAVTRTERPADSAGRSVGQDIVYIFRFLVLHIRQDPVFGTLLWAFVLGSTSISSFVGLRFALASSATTDALVARNHGDVVSTLAASFGYLGVLTLLVFVTTAGQMILRIRLRTVLVNRLLDKWLDKGRLYSIGRETAIDFPEQRVQEDTFGYAQFVIVLIPMIVSVFTTFYLFSGALWERASDYPIHLPGIASFMVPKALYLFALLSAAVLTVLTHLIGRIFTRLDVVRQRLEAGFRDGMGRAREFAEQIVLGRGQTLERERAEHNYRLIRRNWTPYAILSSTLGSVQQLASWGPTLIPTILLFPLIISGSMKMGDLNLSATAFQAVWNALASAATMYTTFALLRAAAQRLHLMEATLSPEPRSEIAHPTGAGSAFTLMGVRVDKPNGQPLFAMDDFRIARGEKWLLKGRSGSGKSTLFRAIGGLWPFGAGSIEAPAPDTSVMFLPQSPYLPNGSLAELLSYPHAPEQFDKRAMEQVLTDVRLSHLAPDIGTVKPWSKILSPGEQQRLVLGRALLQRPEFLFLDEATSALDDDTEAAVFGKVAEQLRASALVTISHTDGTAHHYDHVARIDEGRGTVAEVR